MNDTFDLGIDLQMIGPNETCATAGTPITTNTTLTGVNRGAAADDFLLAVFRTNAAADGFMEEDGEIWAPDGTLLAQCRQLALLMPI